jgi:hypothetical protein
MLVPPSTQIALCGNRMGVFSARYGRSKSCSLDDSSFFFLESADRKKNGPANDEGQVLRPQLDHQIRYLFKLLSLTGLPL